MPFTRLRVQACVTHDIFISFSTRDRLVADSLKGYLEGHGMSCWMSAAAIDAGEVWTRAIVDGITGARAMVLILSVSSNASEHVRREIYLARERHLRILPFRIDGVEPDGDLAYNLAGIQWTQGSAEPTDAEFERLAQSVRGYLSRTNTALTGTAAVVLPVDAPGAHAAGAPEPALTEVSEPAPPATPTTPPPGSDSSSLEIVFEPPPPAPAPEPEKLLPGPSADELPSAPSAKNAAPPREDRAKKPSRGLGDLKWVLAFIVIGALSVALKQFAPF